ncbi:MAG: double zinc ribbon domain-containing protein, partial [Beijerinckiaceae bacterium]
MARTEAPAPRWRLGLHTAAVAARRAAVDMLWPPACVVCKAATQDAHGLCPACWRHLTLIEKPYCERLGTPLPVDHGGVWLSPEAIANPPAFDRARAAAVYDETARLLVTRLKYGDRADLAPTMGT